MCAHLREALWGDNADSQACQVGRRAVNRISQFEPAKDVCENAVVVAGIAEIHKCPAAQTAGKRAVFNKEGKNHHGSAVDLAVEGDLEFVLYPRRVHRVRRKQNRKILRLVYGVGYLRYQCIAGQQLRFVPAKPAHRVAPGRRQVAGRMPGLHWHDSEIRENGSSVSPSCLNIIFPSGIRRGNLRLIRRRWVVDPRRAKRDLIEDDLSDALRAALEEARIRSPLI
jgi:hypothetical protein